MRRVIAIVMILAGLLPLPLAFLLLAWAHHVFTVGLNLTGGWLLVLLGWSAGSLMLIVGGAALLTTRRR